MELEHVFAKSSGLATSCYDTCCTTGHSYPFFAPRSTWHARPQAATQAHEQTLALAPKLELELELQMTLELELAIVLELS